MFASLPSYLQNLILEKVSAPTFVTLLQASSCVKNYVDTHRRSIKKLPINVCFGVRFMNDQISFILDPENYNFAKIYNFLKKEDFKERLKQFIAENVLFRFNFTEIKLVVTTFEMEDFIPLAKDFMAICKEARITGEIVETQFPSLLEEVRENFSPKVLETEGPIVARKYSNQDTVRIKCREKSHLENIFNYLAPVTKSLAIRLHRLDQGNSMEVSEELFQLLKNIAKNVPVHNELFLSFFKSENHPKAAFFLKSVQFTSHKYKDTAGNWLDVCFIKTKEEKAFLALIEYYNVEVYIEYGGYSYKIVRSFEEFMEFYQKSHDFHYSKFSPSQSIHSGNLLANEKILECKKYFL